MLMILLSLKYAVSILEKTLDLLRTWNRWVMMTSQPWTPPKYEMVRDDVKQNYMPEGTAWVDFVTVIVQS